MNHSPTWFQYSVSTHTIHTHAHTHTSIPLTSILCMTHNRAEMLSALISLEYIMHHYLGDIPGNIHVKNHLGTCQKHTFLGPTPDSVNQKLWGHGSLSCVLSILMQRNVWEVLNKISGNLILNQKAVAPIFSFLNLPRLSSKHTSSTLLKGFIILKAFHAILRDLLRHCLLL